MLKKIVKVTNSGKNQPSLTPLKYDHLQVMETITEKFHRYPLKTVGGVAETRLCLRTDGLTGGRTDGRTHYLSPLRLTFTGVCDLHRGLSQGALLRPIVIYQMKQSYVIYIVNIPKITIGSFKKICAWEHLELPVCILVLYSLISLIDKLQ